MNENSNFDELKKLEKNFGLTPADCLILEIQKPKMPSLFKYQSEILTKTKKSITNSPRQSHDIKYKDPKVSLQIIIMFQKN
jgi:hypothetical protein